MSRYSITTFSINVVVAKTSYQILEVLQQQQQQHQKLYLHDHKGITVLQKLLI